MAWSGVANATATRHKWRSSVIQAPQMRSGVLFTRDSSGRGTADTVYPLTISDYRSRYLLACEGLESTKETGALPGL